MALQVFFAVFRFKILQQLFQEHIFVASNVAGIIFKVFQLIFRRATTFRGQRLSAHFLRSRCWDLAAGKTAASKAAELTAGPSHRFRTPGETRETPSRAPTLSPAASCAALPLAQQAKGLLSGLSVSVRVIFPLFYLLFLCFLEVYPGNKLNSLLVTEPQSNASLEGVPLIIR